MERLESRARDHGWGLTRLSRTFAKQDLAAHAHADGHAYNKYCDRVVLFAPVSK
eukprot:COSAG06_NODE_4090_length_4585_cov_2.219795_5_plen_54_part_00